MPIQLNGIKNWGVYYGTIEICNVYRGLTLIRNCGANPTVSSNSIILASKSHTFGTPDFTKDFVAGGGTTHKKVILKSLPIVPELRLLGNTALVNESFDTINASGLKFVLNDRYAVYAGILYRFSKSVTEIISEYEALGYKLTSNTGGKLTFTNQSNTGDSVVVTGQAMDNELLTFNFKVSNDRDELTNEAVLSMIPQGDINVTSTFTNSPPIVGNNTITLRYNQTKTFVKADFTTDTTPVYFDADGDPAKDLLIESLPLHGILKFDGVAIAANTQYSFVDIEAGKLTYEPDSTRTDIESVQFTFKVRDTGSGQFA